MGFFLGLAGQGIAICATTDPAGAVADDYRGRAFSLYDMMFNITFAAGALISAPFMPLTGKSPGSWRSSPIGYAVVAAGYWALPSLAGTGLGFLRIRRHGRSRR